MDGLSSVDGTERGRLGYLAGEDGGHSDILRVRGCLARQDLCTFIVLSGAPGTHLFPCITLGAASCFHNGV